MKDCLPDQFRFAHDFSYFLHDLLVQIIASGEESGIFDVQVTIEDEDKRSDLSHSNDALAWLEANGYRQVAEEVAYRLTFLALLSDFALFVYEALSCSRKDKLVVAFALLRKPLKDNLFYLEWMLVDRAGFLSALLDQGADSLRNRNDEKRQMELMEQVSAILADNGAFDAGLVRELRYRKDSAIGLDRFLTQAHHLVTVESAAIKTEHRNLNLIFRSQGVSEGQWAHLYGTLPYLLNYAVEVAECILGTFAPTEPEFLFRMRMRRNAGLLFWASEMPTIGAPVDFGAMLAECQLVFPKECPACEALWSLDAHSLKGSYRQIYESGSLICPNCSADVFDL